MHRYGSLDFANKVRFKTLTKIINKAFEEKEKEELYHMYLAILPNFDKKTYLTFEQFYTKYRAKPKEKPKLDNRSEEEIMQEILAISKE